MWIRFGSSPGTNLEGKSYSSGTEEEFHLAKSLNKELWIFICDIPFKPSKIDPIQLSKVKRFKEDLKNEDVEYVEFSVEEEFRDMLRRTILEWLSKKYSIKATEKKEISSSLPTKDDFRKYTKGF